MIGAWGYGVAQSIYGRPVACVELRDPVEACVEQDVADVCVVLVGDSSAGIFERSVFDPAVFDTARWGGVIKVDVTVSVLDGEVEVARSVVDATGRIEVI